MECVAKGHGVWADQGVVWRYGESLCFLLHLSENLKLLQNLSSINLTGKHPWIGV